MPENWQTCMFDPLTEMLGLCFRGQRGHFVAATCHVSCSLNSLKGVISGII